MTIFYQIKAGNLMLKARLGPFKSPRQIEFSDTLPRTETGKLQRFKLRQP